MLYDKNEKYIILKSNNCLRKENLRKEQNLLRKDNQI